MTQKNFEAVAILFNEMYGVCGYLLTNNNGTYKYVDNTVARLTRTFVPYEDTEDFKFRCMREMRRMTAKVMPYDFEVIWRNEKTEGVYFA